MNGIFQDLGGAPSFLEGLITALRPKKMFWRHGDTAPVWIASFIDIGYSTLKV